MNGILESRQSHLNQAFFLPENHPNPLDQNAAEMSFGLLEMSFGVLEMSFGVLEMSFEDIAGGFSALEISYGYQWKKCIESSPFDYFWSMIPAPY